MAAILVDDISKLIMFRGDELIPKAIQEVQIPEHI